MVRRGENIYKRKDGRWEGRYKKGRKENGQLKYGYIYRKTYREVKEELYKYKLKYQVFIQLQGESTLSYQDWGLKWLHQKKITIKFSTYSSYLYKMNKYIFPIIGKCSLNELTNENIQQMVINWQKNNLSSSTIHVLYCILKKNLTDAVEQNLLLYNPVRNIRLPKRPRPRAKALTKESQKELESQAKCMPLNQGIPILLALNAGLRIGEISALKWHDVDLKNRELNIQKTVQRVPVGVDGVKTKIIIDCSKTESSYRRIPMTRSLYKYLKKWHKKSKSPYVCSTKETPCEPRLLTYYFHKIRKKCSLETVHFHHLRHTFATRCIEVDSDVASLSRLLGHSSSQTTLDIYADSMIEHRQLIIKEMESSKK